jgi:antirestriction protein ArdC
MTNSKVKEQLEKIYELFSSDKILEIPDTLATNWISNVEKPSSKWSFTNQLIMMAHGSVDARTYNQWIAVGRHVVKGSKAFYILRPVPVTIKEKDKVTGKEETRTFMTFDRYPVFDIASTQGCPLKDPVKRAILPLQEVAEKWGVKVSYMRISGQEGHFSQANNEIVMGVTNPETFYHELAHLAHSKIDGKLNADKKSEQYAKQEMIAELSACVISTMYGQKTERASFEYIKMYSNGKTPEQIGRSLLGVMSKVQKVVELILETSDDKKNKENKKPKKKRASRKKQQTAVEVAKPMEVRVA